MKDLVDILKQQHVDIVDNLHLLEKNIFSDDWRKQLVLSKKLLLEHLTLEDEKMYPIMEEEAEKDVELQETLDMFASEMKEVTEAVLKFFGKYENPECKGTDTFIKDYKAIVTSLSTRILREENILYHDFTTILERK